VTEEDTRRWRLPREKWEHWEVPFDADEEWPEPLQRALADYRQALRQKMDEVNETIAASAPQEVLVDRPKVVKGVVRVSGPFTGDGVQPAEERLALETPIGGAPEELDSFAVGGDDEPANAEAYLERMIGLLRRQGVRFLDNKVAAFERLEPTPGELVHAEGEWVSNGERPHRVAVSFGPQYGPITAAQVERVLRTAYRRGYDDVVFAGFSFDGAAQAAIQEDEGSGSTVRAHIVHVSPDVNMGDLLKDPADSQLFTVSGLPRVRLEAQANGEFVVHMEGVDVYDPVANTIHATKGAKVAAWFVDHDYNGRTFNIGQAFFPDRSAWDKLAKALKTMVDPERFAAFGGQTSLPFPAGEHGRAAVKVIDPRGNEVMRIVRLEGEVTYE
jgi:adenine-specific DNA-methyltransferase